MSKDCENHYKLCRETARITQEQAAELLHISPRTLSDYENGHTKVPDDIVSAMADHYNSPLLAWWHLKHCSILGKFLPDLQMPQTHGDMAFQLWMAQNDLVPTVKDVMEIVGSGLCNETSKGFKDAMAKIKHVHAMLLSTTIYSDQLAA